MMRRIALALAALVVLGGLWLALQREQPRGWEDVGYTFPTLAQPERIEIDRGDERIVLVRDGDAWTLREPLDAPADRMAVEQIARLFETTAVIDFTRDPAEAARYGLDDASTPPRLRLVSGEGASLALTVGQSVDQARTQRTLTWVRPEGAPGLYRVGLDVRGAIDQPLETLRDRQLVRLASTEVEAVDLRQGEETVHLRRREGVWRFVDPVVSAGNTDLADDHDVHPNPDDGRVRTLVNALASLRVTGFADDTTHAEAGLDPPAAEVTLTTTRGESVTLRLGRPVPARPDVSRPAAQGGEDDSAEAYYAARADGPHVVRIAPHHARHLRTARAELLPDAPVDPDDP